MTTWRIAPGIVWRPLSDGGLFVVHTETGDHVGLNRMAASILHLVDDGSSLDAIVTRIEARYGAGRDRIRADVVDLLSNLEESGVVEPVHDGGYAPKPPAQPVHDGGCAPKPPAQPAREDGDAHRP